MLLLVLEGWFGSVAEERLYTSSGYKDLFLNKPGTGGREGSGFLFRGEVRDGGGSRGCVETQKL